MDFNFGTKLLNLQSLAETIILLCIHYAFTYRIKLCVCVCVHMIFVLKVYILATYF